MAEKTIYEQALDKLEELKGSILFFAAAEDTECSRLKAENEALRKALSGVSPTHRMRFAKLQAKVERLTRELAEERQRCASIAHGLSGGWISVAEREPERNVTVLAWDGVTPKMARLEVVFGTPIGWVMASSGHQIHPTHWMPLPEPPK